jgi:hypothetical protein
MEVLLETSTVLIWAIRIRQASRIMRAGPHSSSNFSYLNMGCLSKTRDRMRIRNILNKSEM